MSSRKRRWTRVNRVISSLFLSVCLIRFGFSTRVSSVGGEKASGRRARAEGGRGRERERERERQREKELPLGGYSRVSSSAQCHKHRGSATPSSVGRVITGRIRSPSSSGIPRGAASSAGRTSAAERETCLRGRCSDPDWRERIGRRRFRYAERAVRIRAHDLTTKKKRVYANHCEYSAVMKRYKEVYRPGVLVLGLEKRPGEGCQLVKDFLWADVFPKLMDIPCSAVMRCETDRLY